MTNRQQRLNELFNSIAELSSEAEQAAYLNKHCSGDEQLREDVLELVAHADNMGVFIEREVETRLLTDVGHWHDDQFVVEAQIGPYKLLQQIGEGGMGSVYMAQQSQPVRRKVALKIIKPGMDSKEVISRFEAERQALAMMDHPNVAKVLDAGTTDTGRPYFVMELVYGTPITKFCDENRLSNRERLQIFVDVCRAVQHAHLKGIIHRDLKPSNVLVTMNDDKPMPKVIDFGVSKALSQLLTEKTMFTAFGQMVGTPLYMSPEQAQLSAHDVDVRSDVYSLGVLLYELLTGSTPFDKETLQNSGFDEMRRMIREMEPLRPSVRISTLRAEVISTVADRRRADGRKLSQSLHGELDWIVMRALEKDRTRRYESARAFADDVVRYLDDEPVEACPPSLVYRSRKYARRHRTLLTTVTLVLLVMAASTAVSAWYALEAHSARVIANAESRRALEHADQARRLLYAGDVRLAGLAARRNDVERMRELLVPHIPVGEEEDLRGFEWHFLWKQIEMRPRLLLKSAGSLYFVCFSPDKQMLAAAGQDATIRVLDAQDFKILATIESGQHEVNGLAFSPDSRRIASTGDDGSVCLWNIDDESLVRRIKAYDSLAYQVVFTVDGKALATCGEDPRIRFWDIETGKRLLTINQHDSVVECLAMANNGMLASGAASGTTVLTNLVGTAGNDSPSFDPQNVKWVKGITSWDKGAVTCVAFSSNGAQLAHGQKGGLLTLFDIPGEAMIARQILPDGIQSLAFWSGTRVNGLSLAVGDRGGNVHLLPVDWAYGAQGMITALAESTELQQWKAHDGRVYAMAVHPDGKRLITAGEDGRLCLWNLESRSTRRSLGNLDRGFAVLDNEHVVTAAKGLPVRRLADGSIKTFLASRDSEWATVHVASSPITVIAQNGRGEFYAWEALDSEPERIWSPDPGLRVGASAVSDAGGILAVEVIAPDRTAWLEIISVHSGTVVTRINSGNVDLIAVDPTARWLAFEDENRIQIMDLESGDKIRVLTGHRATIRHIAFSQDSRFLATTSGDRLLKVWDVEHGSEIWSVVAHKNDISAMAFSRDGRTIATAGNDGLLRLWRWRLQRMVMELPIKGRLIRRLEFSPDDRRIVPHETSSLMVYDASPTDSSGTRPQAPGKSGQ